MKTLVLGGTGTVGGAVVKGLLATGVTIAALTRSEERARPLPDGVEARIGDLDNVYGVGSAFEGIESLFLLNAVSPSETQQGLVALQWAKAHGVRHIVYLSIQHVERAPHIPHFAAKIVVEQAIKASGIDYTILQPNNFYQNDYWFKDVIPAHGVYPQPIGEIGLNRVDVRDIADAAVQALTTAAGRNKTFILAGPDALTGSSTAEIYARHLDQVVGYGGDDLNAWERQSLAHMAAWMAFDFRLMYQWFQTKGLRADAAELYATEALMGHPARSFDAFVQETVASWR